MLAKPPVQRAVLGVFVLLKFSVPYVRAKLLRGNLRWWLDDGVARRKVGKDQLVCWNLLKYFDIFLPIHMHFFVSLSTHLTMPNPIVANYKGDHVDGDAACERKRAEHGRTI